MWMLSLGAWLNRFRFFFWEATGRLLGGYWEATGWLLGGLLGGYWVATGWLLGGYWGYWAGCTAIGRPGSACRFHTHQSHTRQTPMDIHQ